jgi:hypothetical protein
MKSEKRIFTILWKVAVSTFFMIIIIYLFIGFILPAPKEPEPISIEGSIFEKVFEPFDGQFVSVYIARTISNEEGLRYIQDWKNLNSGFDRRDLTEFVGFDKPIKTISRIRCLVIIDCRNGNYLRFKEEHLDVQGRLIHYISSDEGHNKWNRISKNSTIDELAKRFCEPSAY